MSVAALAPWTFSELDGLPDDGSRYEIVDGNLLVTPPPTDLHHMIGRFLQRELDVDCPVEWIVMTEFSLRMSTDVRVPDLAIVRSDVKISREDRNPYRPEHFGLVGEIVSPRTHKTDLHAKRGEYAEAGIPIYWLIHVDPHFRIQALVLRDGVYIEIDGPLPTPWGTVVPDLGALGLD